jgi:hypothetical protein
MAPKFDQLIPRYAILILRNARIARDHTYAFISQRIRNKILKNILQHESGTYMGLFDEKNQMSKIS